MVQTKVPERSKVKTLFDPLSFAFLGWPDDPRMVCIRATILTNGSNGTDGLCSHKYLRFGGSWLEIATALPSSASAAGSTTPTAQKHRRAQSARHVRWPTARNLAQTKECGKEQAQGFSSTSNPVILVGSTVPLCVGLHVSRSLTPAGTFAGPQQKLLLVAVRAHHLRYSTRKKTDGIPALQRLSDRRGILGEPSNEMAQTSRRATASSPKFRKMMKVEPPSWATGLQGVKGHQAPLLFRIDCRKLILPEVRLLECHRAL